MQSIARDSDESSDDEFFDAHGRRHPGAHGTSQEGEGRGLRERQGMQVKVGITCEEFWLNSSTWGQGQDETKPPGVWGLTLTLTWYRSSCHSY